jgi:hypothetical protein
MKHAVTNLCPIHSSYASSSGHPQQGGSANIKDNSISHNKAVRHLVFYMDVVQVRIMHPHYKLNL